MLLAVVALLFASNVVVGWLLKLRTREVESMQNTLEQLANEIAYQNQLLAQDLVSDIRQQVERGNVRHEYLIPVVYAVNERAETMLQPGVLEQHPDKVNEFVSFADSVYAALSLSTQMRADSVDALSLSPLQRKLHVRLVQRGALHFLHGQAVRILSMPDTLALLVVPKALQVAADSVFEAQLRPYWTASGFHPYEQYLLSTTLGEIEPDSLPGTFRLAVPTRKLLTEEDGPQKEVEVLLTLQLRQPMGTHRRIRVPVRFWVYKPCTATEP
jgi:hypothetical protein